MTKKSFFVASAALAASLTFNNLAEAQTATTSTTSSTTNTTASSTDTTKTTSNAGASASTNAATGTSTQNLTFTSLLAASGLDKTLQGEYTLFAPSNDALAQLTPDTTAAGKAKLTALLSNHIVKGKLTSKDLAKAIAAGKGTASLTTLSGGKINLKVNANKNLEVSDANGNTALATNFDKESTNGILHIIDKPLAPKQ